jgi:hypothetical protein
VKDADDGFIYNHDHTDWFSACWTEEDIVSDGWVDVEVTIRFWDADETPDHEIEPPTIGADTEVMSS